MQRYFASTFNNQVILSKDDVFHLTKVMRVKSGDYIEIVDENHQPYLAVVVNVNPLVIEKQEPIIIKPTSTLIKTFLMVKLLLS